jgi:hypothetical protein
MRIFKNKDFNKWAAKEGIEDNTLVNAVDEMERGLINADLGGHVFKKRVGTVGRGKSGGVRTLLAYKLDDKAFFIYGFAKNARSNISAKELKSLKLYAKELLGYNDRKLEQAKENNVLIELEVEDNG